MSQLACSLALCGPSFAVTKLMLRRISIRPRRSRIRIRKHFLYLQTLSLQAVRRKRKRLSNERLVSSRSCRKKTRRSTCLRTEARGAGWRGRGVLPFRNQKVGLALLNRTRRVHRRWKSRARIHIQKRVRSVVLKVPSARSRRNPLPRPRGARAHSNGSCASKRSRRSPSSESRSVSSEAQEQAFLQKSEALA